MLVFMDYKAGNPRGRSTTYENLYDNAKHSLTVTRTGYVKDFVEFDPPALSFASERP